MRILITGGYGFIGGRLGQHLQQAGHQVVLGSRSISGPPDWLPQADVIQTCWNDTHLLEACCSGIDVVIQAAGMNAQDCSADPVEALECNAIATARLLQVAIQQKVKRFIYLSTAHVYGSPLSGVITEETCPTNLHAYATSHRAGEDVVRTASERGQIEGIVIRLSNAYGAPMSKDVNCWMLLVNDLCYQAVTSRKMVLRSTGVQQRDFVTLTKTCGAIVHLLELSNEELGNSLYNVGGSSMRVIDMTKMIQERCLAILGYAPEIIRPEVFYDGVSPELDYRTDKLSSSGFSLHGDSVAEIDATLKACKEFFGSES